MNERYLNLMEKTLTAYSNEHIIRFFNDVKEKGFKDQGFPRLTANIGILIANGRRKDLIGLFLEMMEFCCKTIPNVKAANDFSVREVISCIAELEKSNVINGEDVLRWKGYFSSIDPKKCYNRFAEKPTDPIRNWALFTATSEFFRQKMGLCNSSEFIDVQIASQLQWIDENGMYMDNAESRYYQPIVYDLVPRGLFSLLLYAGYRGKYYADIDGILKRAGLKTLYMQSACGEVAFGGRSNQFLHNEAWLAAIFEYEAVRYQKSNELALAGKFKAAANKALNALDYWLAKNPITHVKNRFPIDSKFGCETYADFNKYMITAASFLYVASLFCDDSIVPTEFDESPTVWSTSKYFHKTFVRAGGYSLEFDANADPHYDGSGLGRIHKRNAPSAICLSLPFAEAPYYYGGKIINSAEIVTCPTGKRINPAQFSICPAVRGENGEWFYAANSQTKYRLVESNVEKESSRVVFKCSFINGSEAEFSCSVAEDGVFIEASSYGDENIGIAFPTFKFDGETHTKICCEKGRIQVEYGGWICEYSTRDIFDLQTDFFNRNGFYKGYVANGKGKASLRIKIYPLQ